MEKLSTAKWQQHKDRNPPPAPGTCIWMLEHPMYLEWLTDDKLFLLWISANPGCGKSVLASYLIDHQMERNCRSKPNVCYFFFKSDNHDQRSGVTALQSLLRQLYEQQPKLADIGVSCLKGKSLDDLGNLWLAFVKSVQQSTSAGDDGPIRTFCVFDGLDECDAVDSRKLVRLISDTFLEKGSTLTGTEYGKLRHGLLKVLVLSRPDNFIRAAFDRTTANSAQPNAEIRTAMLRLRGEDETGSISADISRVIDATVSNLVGDGLPIDFLLDVKHRLIRQADRTFLWVTLILQLLVAKVDTGASRRELDAILKSRDIDAIYSEMLATRVNVPKARRMLSIILASARPLTTSEMSIALAITPDHNPLEPGRGPRRPDKKTFSHLEYNLVYPFETHLKSICGNFVRIIHDKVYLVHETARAFLLEPKLEADPQHWPSVDEDIDPFEEWPEPLEGYPSHAIPLEKSKTVLGPWQHSFSIEKCEALLLHICTTYLYMMGKKCSEAELGQPSEATIIFLEYASMFWHRHFGAIRDMITSRDLRYYENLCHPMFPGFFAWTEALLGEEKAIQIATVRSTDELQDYYVDLLGIELSNSVHGDVCTDLIDSGLDAETLEARDYAHQLSDNMTQLRYSSNPATLSNHGFPLATDETGFVSLAVSSSSRQQRKIERPTLPEVTRPNWA